MGSNTLPSGLRSQESHLSKDTCTPMSAAAPPTRATTINSKILTNRLKLQRDVLRVYDGLSLGHIKTTLNEEIVPLETDRPGFNPWVRKTPGEGHSKPLQYSCPENPMDRGAWRATQSTHGVTKSQTRLSTHTQYGVYGVYVLEGMCWLCRPQAEHA